MRLKENGVPGQRAEHTETVVGLSEESKTGHPRSGRNVETTVDLGSEPDGAEHNPAPTPLPAANPTPNSNPTLVRTLADPPNPTGLDREGEGVETKKDGGGVEEEGKGGKQLAEEEVRLEENDVTCGSAMGRRGQGGLTGKFGQFPRSRFKSDEEWSADNVGGDEDDWADQWISFQVLGLDTEANDLWRVTYPFHLFPEESLPEADLWPYLLAAEEVGENDEEWNRIRNLGIPVWMIKDMLSCLAVDRAKAKHRAYHEPSRATRGPQTQGVNDREPAVALNVVSGHIVENLPDAKDARRPKVTVGQSPISGRTRASEARKKLAEQQPEQQHEGARPAIRSSERVDRSGPRARN